MLETLDHQVAYIPLHHIVSQKEYRYRILNETTNENLKNSLLKSGQSHPITLEEVEPSEYRIVDGHLRFDAISDIKKSGGDWEKILAQIIPASSHSPIDRFKLILEKNMRTENAYGLYERACFFRKTFQEGVSIKTIADATGFSTHAVEDHIELSAAKMPLAQLINHSKLDATFALMLHHRYEAWLQTPYANETQFVIQKLIQHASAEKHTTKSWRFLLDFYWHKNRPFLSGRARKS